MSEKKSIPNLSADEFTGPVRQMKHLCYQAFKKGNEVVQGNLDKGQHPNKNNLCRYNEQGTKTEEEIIYDNGGWLLSRYNDKGKQFEHINFEFDGTIGHKTDYTYSESGKTLQSVTRKANGDHYFSTVYEYNEKDLLETMKHFRTNGELEYIHTKYYDQDGHIIESKSVKPDGTIQSWDKHSYNEHGDATDYTRLNPDGSIQYFYEYHPQYDDEGNRINIYRHYEEPQIYDYEYEYDSRGNWIKKIESYRHIPIYISQGNPLFWRSGLGY